jgi:hypothetical protein
MKIEESADTRRAEAVEIAEWCGWELVEDSDWDGDISWRYVSPTEEPHVEFTAELYLRPVEAGRALPKYHTSLDACAEFERVAEERGKWDEYQNELLLTLYPKSLGARPSLIMLDSLKLPFNSDGEFLPVRWDAAGKLIRATASARVAAILRVIRAGKETP